MPTLAESLHLARQTPAGLAIHHSKGRWQLYKYLSLLNREVMELASRRNNRLMVFMHPRVGKSEFCSHYTPAWWKGNFPDEDIILGSYEADFAETWGRKARDVLVDVGQDVFGVEVSKTLRAAKQWGLEDHLGQMSTAGVGGPMTGKGAHLLIIDDPVKNWEEATSPTRRANAYNWYQSVARTRLEPGGVILLMMTRWHEADLAGMILENEPGRWRVIVLPAICDEPGDPLGREMGQALCPERYNVKALEDLKIDVGPYAWQALYQQRPSALEGAILRRDWWNYYVEEPKHFDEVLQSWDLAFKDTKQSDFVVGQVWGRKGADKYLLDQVRARLDFPKTEEAILNLSVKHRRASAKLIEDKANGPAVIAALKKKVSGLVAVNPEGNKESRVYAVSPQIEAGNVYLPHPSTCSWINDFVDECARFPTGAHDDQVDAMTQALLRLDKNSLKARNLLAVWSEEELED